MALISISMVNDSVKSLFVSLLVIWHPRNEYSILLPNFSSVSLSLTVLSPYLICYHNGLTSNIVCKIIVLKKGEVKAPRQYVSNEPIYLNRWVSDLHTFEKQNK